jgi:hypothetical protein
MRQLSAPQKLVSFSRRNVFVLSGTSISMTFADVCCIRSIFNSLVMQQCFSRPLSYCCSDWSSLVVREQNASNHSRSYVHPDRKIPIKLTSQLVLSALRRLLPPEAAHLVRLPPGASRRYCHNMVGDAQAYLISAISQLLPGIACTLSGNWPIPSRLTDLKLG